MPSLGFGVELGQVRVWSEAQDIRIYINIGVYKYMKIHITLMSIYQNSNMCIYTKKFIAHKINPFNYKDLNIFLQYYFLQQYCLIFYNFSVYIYIL